MAQLDLFDGESRKTDGMQRAIDNAPADYRRLFLEWITNQAVGSLYTSETITEEIGLPRGEQNVSNRNNSVGALMNAAAKMGLQQKISMVKAKKPNQNATTIGLWQRSEEHNGS